MKETIQLAIFVKPNAKQTRLVEIKDGVLHIALHAKPQEGEANKELIRFLADYFDIPKSQIDLIKGHHSRHKVVSVPARAQVKITEKR